MEFKVYKLPLSIKYAIAPKASTLNPFGEPGSKLAKEAIKIKSSKAAKVELTLKVIIAYRSIENLASLSFPFYSVPSELQQPTDVLLYYSSSYFFAIHYYHHYLILLLLLFIHIWL